MRQILVHLFLLHDGHQTPFLLVQTRPMTFPFPVGRTVHLEQKLVKLVYVHKGAFSNKLEEGIHHDFTRLLFFVPEFFFAFLDEVEQVGHSMFLSQYLHNLLVPECTFFRLEKSLVYEVEFMAKLNIFLDESAD